VPPHQRRISRVLTTVFFLAALAALVIYARSIHWAPVFDAVRSYRGSTLALAGGLAALSCLFYSTFDLLTRTHAQHRVPWPWVIGIAFSAYTFNLNLGPWIGSFGARLRLYSRLGIGSAHVLRMIAFTTVTNWLGYFALAGTVFAMEAAPVLPADWRLGGDALQLIGFALLAIVAGYCLLCALASKRVYHVRGITLRLPPLRMALGQTALATLNWVLIAAVPFVLLKGAVPFSLALTSLLLACAVGALAHIPAGIGVIDAVLMATLGREVPMPEMVAALLVYRAVYYLWPFVLGLLTYVMLETILRRRTPHA
jgi:hypothetical protein